MENLILILILGIIALLIAIGSIYFCISNKLKLINAHGRLTVKQNRILFMNQIKGDLAKLLRAKGFTVGREFSLFIKEARNNSNNGLQLLQSKKNINKNSNWPVTIKVNVYEKLILIEYKTYLDNKFHVCLMYNHLFNDEFQTLYESYNYNDDEEYENIKLNEEQSNFESNEGEYDVSFIQFNDLLDIFNKLEEIELSIIDSITV